MCFSITRYLKTKIIETTMRSNTHSFVVALILLSFLLPAGLHAQFVLQRCDVTNLWQGSNAISLSTADKKEGAGSITFTGSGTDWFAKKFSQADVGVDPSGWFSFWLYVSDVTALDGDGQVELTSSGGPDVDEYSWSIGSLGLTDGWNHVQLQISAANVTGAPDLQAINYFRIYQVLSGEITARLDDLRFTAGMDPDPLPGDPLDIDTPDFTTLDGKVMFGYQGWFAHPDDSSEWARWRHWGEMQGAGSIGVEMLPDMREHEVDEEYMTGLTYEDGSAVTVYSAYNRKTVMRHMKWLRDYDLDGVFLQRFNVSTLNGDLRALRDTVTANVMAGCEKYDRAFVNMYDLSGLGGGRIDELIADWKHLVDDLKILESPNYLWHRGKPLISLWGFTVRDDLTVTDLEQAIEFFTNSPEEKYRASIMLGTNHDFFNRGAWTSLLSQVDVISPWAVGRFDSPGGNASFINNYVKPGQDWCDAHNVDFLPVVWPGFSWYNLKRERESQKNQIPRNGGEFFWTQATRVVSANAKSVYIAMFDEVDEGTAMYKLAETEADVPAQGFWVPLDADGYDLPSDWYLRSAKKLTYVVRGVAENTPSLETPPDGIDNFRVEVQSTKCGTTDGKLTFHFPEAHADSLPEFSIDGGNTYPYRAEAGSTSLETGALTGGVYNVWVRRSDGSFPTDLGPYTIFDFYPRATFETVRTTCGYVDGSLEIQLDDTPDFGPVEFSIDGGNTWALTTEEGTWDYSIDGLGRGEYSVWARWADGSCPAELETLSIEAEPIPVTLYASVDGEAFEVFDSVNNALYGCPGFSLEIYAEPAEDGWDWSWSGDEDFQATGRTVQIAEQLTTPMYGKYYVSYVDEVNDCQVEEQLFFIRAKEDCPVGTDPMLHGEQNIRVFPNPSEGIFRFIAPGSTGISSIEISDISGRVVYRQKDLSAGAEVHVDLSEHDNGTYLYRIEGKDQQVFEGMLIRK